MNIFKNKKIRLLVLVTLAVLQMINFMLTSQLYSNFFFLIINFLYMILGFLSIGWKQGLQNISWVTLPIVVFIASTFLAIPLISGRSVDIASIFQISLQLWGLILMIGLPLFLLGIGIRYLGIKILKK